MDGTSGCEMRAGNFEDIAWSDVVSPPPQLPASELRVRAEGACQRSIREAATLRAVTVG
jgi:hypothetical protein